MPRSYSHNPQRKEPPVNHRDSSGYISPVSHNTIRQKPPQTNAGVGYQYPNRRVERSSLINNEPIQIPHDYRPPARTIQLPRRARTGFWLIIAGAAVWMISYFLPMAVYPLYGGMNVFQLLSLSDDASGSTVLVGYLFLAVINIVCAVIPLKAKLKNQSGYKLFTIGAYLQGVLGLLEMINFSEATQMGIQMGMGLIIMTFSGIVMFAGALMVSFAKPDGGKRY